MITAGGKSVVKGIAIGKIKVYKAPVFEISEALTENTDAELQRFEDALQKAEA